METQPPSGGCVLKHLREIICRITGYAAAFGRLCVETPASVGTTELKFAAAFGRLCVETTALSTILNTVPSSRLRAAVC